MNGETFTRSNNTTVLVTGNGLAESREEAAVYVCDVDVFCHSDVIGKTHQNFFSLREFCEEMIYSHDWTAGEPPSLSKDGNITWCETDNHVPTVAVTKECSVPEDMASGSLLPKKTCGESAPVAQSSEITHWLQPFEEGQSAEAPTSENIEGRTKEEVTFTPTLST